ncbi:hypothetical protein H2199_009227 [Coniosporium tulheliwenetii]|uniref:Uncharacterized protein n=1 Tax=Coniosporium tulheliwenetii TaxID=3383036 RepID=A0ACC2YET8_9PEZI|nr:hypothetical protein H2199_009227 [Cladosporium sp. JES 115]
MSADPISIIGLVGQVGDLLWKAYNYGKEVYEAQEDMKSLFTDLSVLKSTLEQMQKSFTPHGEDTIAAKMKELESSRDFQSALRSTQELVARLIQNLSKKRMNHRKLHALAWPLVKDDVKADIDRLERIKSWFIMVIMADDSVRLRALMSESGEILKIVQEEQARRKNKEEDETTQRIRGWLQFVSSKRLHIEACKKRKAQTGLWFINRKFREWAEGQDKKAKVLWLSGRSGAGKTVLISTAVEEARALCKMNPKIGVAFFYCTYGDLHSQEPIGVLGSIAYQLSEQLPRAMSSLDLLRKDQEAPSEPALCALILDHVSAFEKFLIIVDAINESYRSADVLNELLKLTSSCTTVRLLVTAISDHQHFLGLLDGKLPLPLPEFMDVEIKTEQIENDLRCYVMARTEEEPLLRELDAETKDKMQATLLEKANGMFRYVQCQLDYLKKLRTTQMVIDELYCLPEDLFATYERILTNIPEPDNLLAREALNMLAVALRPVTLLELAEAAVINVLYRDTCIDNRHRLRYHTVLVDICQGLITYDKTSSIVSLAHSSIRAFLTSDRISKGKASWYGASVYLFHQIIAEKCLKYLMFDHFRGGCVEEKRDLEKRLTEYPLLKYSAQYWPVHARLSGNKRGPDSLLVPQILRFFLTGSFPNGGNLSSWAQCLMPDAPSI